MSINVWEKFDKAIDTQALKEDVQSAAENTGDYREVPHGNYEVKIEKLELVESKTGKPMMACWMKIVSGQYKNCYVFYNQVLHAGFGIHKANEFLRSLESRMVVEFENFTQFHNLLQDIHEDIDGTLEYEVEYGEDKRGYSTYEIKAVFEA